MINKLCIICRNSFLPNSNNHKYCSKECFDNYRRNYKKIYDKNYHKEHKLEHKKRDSAYYINNREEILKRTLKYTINRYKIDIDFKIGRYLRTRISNVLKGLNKSKSTMILIGCSIKQLKKYLERQFTKDMSWSNYGKWHVDHIRPCASFDLSKPEEQKQCFHYTNLQPLWATENLSKNKY